MQILPLILIFFVFYFLLILPQQKKQKQMKKMIEELKKGDKVITVGGMCGEVVGVKDRIIALKLAENVVVDFVKDAVAFGWQRPHVCFRLAAATLDCGSFASRMPCGVWQSAHEAAFFEPSWEAWP